MTGWSLTELRRRLGRASTPELVILSGGGSIAPSHPALDAGALVLTSAPGAARLRPRLSDASMIVAPSPRLAGAAARESRFGLAEGVDVLPPGVQGRLLGLRQQGAHLFRYEPASTLGEAADGVP